MGQKDLASKKLEIRPDIYADIINALLYEGRQVLKPQNLQSAAVESLYMGDDGILRSQYNDVSKYELYHGRIRMRYTLENQTVPDYRMLLRKAGYEGAVYRQQYDGGATYPLITLVLYWGKKTWHPVPDIYSYFGKRNLPEPVWQYIDNTALRVFHMRRLPETVRKRFRSDMRIIVDYLAEGSSYEPIGQPIRYLEDVLRLLYELTGDIGFVSRMGELQERQKKGEKITMCEVIDKFEARGREQGIKIGIKKGIKKGRKFATTNCAKTFTSISISQGQTQQYIMEMLQRCFGLDEEKARELYQENVDNILRKGM